ncbi:peroxin 11c [Fusarium flagelliforme]|uniref:Peroxin 11c n=1 Tax=Fusarium flagelliforme TaxID=2675880 RepID=A0A395MPT1_9HYPO|nr:peroxin 11c [Fusarium flagelliforme]
MTETETVTAVESPAEAIVIPSAEPVVADSPPVADHKITKKDEVTEKNSAKKISPLARLLKSPSALDAFILHLHRVIRTRQGTDTVLLFTTYVARLIGAILDILGRTTLRHSARKIVEMAFKIPPSTSVVLSTATAPPLATLALSLSRNIQGFTNMMGEWRTMNRFWGIIGTYLEARDLVLRLRGEAVDEKGQKLPAPNKVNVAFMTVQILCNFVYNIGEGACWLTCKGATNLSEKTSAKLGLYAARSWSVWVALELVRLLVERARRTPSGDVTAEEEWKSDWKANFIATLPWMPLSAHWGTEQGLMPEIAVATIATLPATKMMKDLWRQTA